MKWYFAVTEHSLASFTYDWPAMIRAAVTSALRCTTLTPIMLYDGADNALISELRALGVQIVPHRLSFLDPLCHYITKHNRSTEWANFARGAFMRYDIPLLEKNENYVLYTDCDVLFLREPPIYHLRPHYFAAGPQFTFEYSDMNSGVMVINVENMRRDHDGLVHFSLRNLDTSPDFDQSLLRHRYQNCYDSLPPELNWKPYWGLNNSASILHFHGPKPIIIELLRKDCGLSVPEPAREIHAKDPDNYAVWTDLWKESAGVDYPSCVIDHAGIDMISGWGTYKYDRRRPVMFTAYVNGEAIGNIHCSNPRSDVMAAGMAPENCGFTFRMAMRQRPALELTLRDAQGRLAELIYRGDWCQSIMLS